jgi:hypothetical protein
MSEQPKQLPPWATPDPTESDEVARLKAVLFRQQQVLEVQHKTIMAGRVMLDGWPLHMTIIWLSGAIIGALLMKSYLGG